MIHDYYLLDISLKSFEEWVKEKETLINLLNDHPEIANYIERYMDELI